MSCFRPSSGNCSSRMFCRCCFSAQQASSARISAFACTSGEVARKAFRRSVNPCDTSVSALTTSDVSTSRKRVCDDWATRSTSAQFSDGVVDKMREIAATRQSALPRRSEATASRRSSASMIPKTTWVRMIAPSSKNTSCPVRVLGQRRVIRRRVISLSPRR